MLEHLESISPSKKIELNISLSIIAQIETKYANRHAYQLCVMRGDGLGVSPARHALSDRRINSSHGNNIFIFQGQRFVFFPSSCQTVNDTFRAPAVCSGCRRDDRDAVYLKPTRERKTRGKLVANWRAIINSFRKISKTDPKLSWLIYRDVR